MPDSATPWTADHQSPMSMRFSRQGYWSGSPFPSPSDLPNLGIDPGSPALQADSSPSGPPGKPLVRYLLRRSKTAGTQGKFVSDFLSNCQTVFQCDCTHFTCPSVIYVGSSVSTSLPTLVFLLFFCSQHGGRVYHFLFFGHNKRHCDLSSPIRRALHWEPWVSTTGPPEKSLYIVS